MGTGEFNAGGGGGGVGGGGNSVMDYHPIQGERGSRNTCIPSHFLLQITAHRLYVAIQWVFHAVGKKDLSMSNLDQDQKLICTSIFSKISMLCI